MPLVAGNVARAATLVLKYGSLLSLVAERYEQTSVGACARPIEVGILISISLGIRAPAQASAGARARPIALAITIATILSRRSAEAPVGACAGPLLPV